VAKLLLKVREAGVAYEIVLRGEGDQFNTLTLVAEELRVVARKLNKTGKIVFAIKFEQRLKGRESRETEGVRLDDFDLGRLPLEYYLVFLVAGAQSE
jgi:hypothetical protein